MGTAEDPLLIVGMSLLIFIMLIVNVYNLVYWQHPQDKNNSYVAKALILYGWQLTAISVLMLPVGKLLCDYISICFCEVIVARMFLDVANNAGDPRCDPSSLLNTDAAGYCGNIRFFDFWQSMFCMICFVVIVMLPFATFYYEADETDLVDETIRKSRLKPAIIQEGVVIAVFLAILLALYYTKSNTNIAVSEKRYDISDFQIFNYSGVTAGSNPYIYLPQRNLPKEYFAESSVDSFAYITTSVSFLVYLIGLFSWLGWWMFSIFGGVGLATMPFDLIVSYIWRPRLLAPDEMASIELELQERTKETVELTMMLKKERNNASSSELRKRFMSDRLEINRLNQMVFMLERDIDEFVACKEIRNNYNPLIPFAKLGAGAFSALLSILWILQIILSILTSPPASPFLSLYLVSFDQWFPMFGNNNVITVVIVVIDAHCFCL
jgi:LMBR1 domain-containing protein 1